MLEYADVRRRRLKILESYPEGRTNTTAGIEDIVVAVDVAAGAHVRRVVTAAAAGTQPPPRTAILFCTIFYCIFSWSKLGQKVKQISNLIPTQ